MDNLTFSWGMFTIDGRKDGKRYRDEMIEPKDPHIDNFEVIYYPEQE